MKTKLPERPVGASFPTCGEVFEFLVNAVDLAAWPEYFSESKVTDKTRAKSISDQLRDWAREPEGRVPSRADFTGFIRKHTADLRMQHAEALCTIMEWLVEKTMAMHRDVIRGNATYLNRDGARSWYCYWHAPAAITVLYQFRLLLRHLPNVGGPILCEPLHDLLGAIGQPDAPRHPMLKKCFAHYLSKLGSSVSEADVVAWRNGTVRPQPRSLAEYYRGHKNMPEVMINFWAALLIEELGQVYRLCAKNPESAGAMGLLVQQAKCLRQLDEELEREADRTAHFALVDYAGYLDDSVQRFHGWIQQVIGRGGDELLNLRYADYRAFVEYEKTLSRFEPPRDFDVFKSELNELWDSSRLSEPPERAQAKLSRLSALHMKFPDWCAVLEGVVGTVEVRLTLQCESNPTAQTLLDACAAYREAVNHARYRAGTYTVPILREALGLAALVQREKNAEGVRLLDWIKNTLAWWDLVELGSDFDHEQEAQRVEKAARRFIDEMHNDLRQRWRSTLGMAALDHAYVASGLVGFIETEATDRLKVPVDKRQKRALLSSAVGRDQTPLMEAIDGKNLEQARRMVAGGADLNFINSTGDTCVTKAFAVEDYDLVLAILRREESPILRRVLLRETDKHRHSALERAIAHGRVEILRELAKWKRGRGDVIDLSGDRIMGGQTPLYYAVMLTATHRMSLEDQLKYMLRTMPDSQAAAIAHALAKNPEAHARILDFKKEIAEHGYPQGSGMGRPDRAIEVIHYLLDEADVEVDATCTNHHTAFTLAAEHRMHDIALRLLQAGANVNHRIVGGITALCFAIRHNDYEMAKLLHEYRADDRIFVEQIGRPIHAMEMSDKIREIFPRRIS